MNEKIRVLLVDDEEAFVRGMARLLKSRGFDVTTSLRGAEAVEAVKCGGSFDVVVMDIKMPGMNGIEALGEIKKLAPDVEVIMLTGHASVSSGVQALRMGAYDYLMKPCDAEDLIEKIREAHEAESIRKNPVLWPRKRVGEIVLHPVRRLLPEDRLAETLEAMRREKGEEAVEEIFIVTEPGVLVGVLTRRHLLDLAVKTPSGGTVRWNELIDHPEWLPELPIHEAMAHDPPSSRESATLSEAAEQMILHRVRSLPVLRGATVLGVIRLQDVFRHLEQEIE